MHWASLGLVQRPPAVLLLGMLWGDVLGPISSRPDAQCQRMIEVQINDKLAKGINFPKTSLEMPLKILHLLVLQNTSINEMREVMCFALSDSFSKAYLE